MLMVLGLILIVAGIGGAIALVIAGSSRYGDGIEKLARGPANCATVLDVAASDTYYFYVETEGDVAEVRGDCPAVGESFEADGADEPSLALADREGDGVRLRRADGISYDANGYSGEVVHTRASCDEGRYILTVTRRRRRRGRGRRRRRRPQARPVVPIAVGVRRRAGRHAVARARWPSSPRTRRIAGERRRLRADAGR